MDFKEKLLLWAEIINKHMEEFIKIQDVPQKSIYEAMQYSLMAGGKRLRPVLSLAICELLDKDMELVIPCACALEMIHTYSLIHDDLPSMDNDDYRRGRLTSHKVFGEATAILAGDALLNKAFEIMINDALTDTVNMEKKLKGALIVAKASGDQGMIAGQVVDMESEGKNIDVNTLKYMHRCKTGAMIKASVMAPGEILGANTEQMTSLERYAECIGLAFQIKDDILDVESTLEELGKPTGSDQSNNKATYVSLLGLEKSKEMLNDVIGDAIASLDIFGNKAAFLIELAQYISNRTK